MKRSNKIIVFMFFIATGIYGMENDDVLCSGDFTRMPDDIMQHIFRYLYEPLPCNCKAEDFKRPSFRDMFCRLRNSNPIRCGRFDMTCKRFNVLSNPCICANKIILSDLLFDLLRYSKQNNYTVSNLSLCIHAGVDVNCLNEWGQTPLVYAISTPASNEIINLLIALGANVNQEGALENAICYEYFDIVTLLIKHGADVNRLVNLAKTEKLEGYYRGIKQVIEHFVKNHVPESKKDDVELSDSCVSDDGSFGASLENENVTASSYGGYSSISSKSDSFEESQTFIPEMRNVFACEDDSSSSSENDTIYQQKPHIYEPASGNTEPDVGMFVPMSCRICANPLVVLVGIGAVSSFCYWVYKKYKAYKKSQEQSHQDEQIEMCPNATEASLQ